MNQPLVHPGSAWVDPGRAGDPGSVGLSRLPGHPGFGLVYPGLVGLSRGGRVNPGCRVNPGLPGSTRVGRVIPSCSGDPGLAGSSRVGRVIPAQSGMTQPLVHPGSAWVDPGRAGDPGWVGLSRSPGHPGFGLVYPGSVGLSSASGACSHVISRCHTCKQVLRSGLEKSSHTPTSLFHFASIWEPRPSEPLVLDAKGPSARDACTMPNLRAECECFESDGSWWVPIARLHRKHSEGDWGCWEVHDGRRTRRCIWCTSECTSGCNCTSASAAAQAAARGAASDGIDNDNRCIARGSTRSIGLSIPPGRSRNATEHSISSDSRQRKSELPSLHARQSKGAS